MRPASTAIPALLVAGVWLLLAAAPADAGRLIATGHDADNHCSLDGTQCHFLGVATSYVRGGAPHPERPVLALSCSGRLESALDSAVGAFVPKTVVCPSTDPRWPSIAITPDAFSAIIVGSTLKSINLNPDQERVPNPVNPTAPDSAAISTRKAAIASFFNGGGGILALAGDANGDGDPANGPDTYYEFVPIPLTGRHATAPFRLTDQGRALGFQDAPGGVGVSNDINCCPTHNSFQEPPAGSPLQVAERDSSVRPDGAPAAAAETLVAEGLIRAGQLVKPLTLDEFAKLPSNKRCVSRRHFRIRFHNPRGFTLKSGSITLNARRVKAVKGKRLRAPVDLRGLPKGRFTVKLVAIATNGTRFSGQRRYRTCTPKRKHRDRQPL